MASKLRALALDSIQGDIRFIEAARHGRAHQRPQLAASERGAWPLKAIDLDCNHIPDAAMTLAVMALYAKAPPPAQHCQLARQGNRPHRRHGHRAAQARRHRGRRGGLIIASRPATRAGWLEAASIHTYDDHRVAMCFSLAAFNPAGLPVRIEDPKCVAKTFPTTLKPFSLVHRALMPFQ
jgi:3-phosphoshikimate 1-carboxyvinyltransferase